MEFGKLELRMVLEKSMMLLCLLQKNVGGKNIGARAWLIIISRFLKGNWIQFFVIWKCYSLGIVPYILASIMSFYTNFWMLLISIVVEALIQIKFELNIFSSPIFFFFNFLSFQIENEEFEDI